MLADLADQVYYRGSEKTAAEAIWRRSLPCRMEREMSDHEAIAAGLRRFINRSFLVALCLCMATQKPHAQDAEAAPNLRKWVGTWKEPNPVVGTRSIITLQEEGGKIVGTISDPPVPGLAQVRIPFKLQDVKVVDEDTLSWKESGIAVKARFIPGEDGSPATMETSKEAKGTIGWYLGQRKPHVARLKKE